MKIILPKASKGLKFDLVFTVEMNDFRLLSQKCNYGSVGSGSRAQQ